MSSTTPSTRRLRRAGSVAAAAAIALSAAVGFGVAPASAATDSAVTADSVNHIRVHTHWLASGVNVRSIRVVSPVIIQNGHRHSNFDRCFSMGNFHGGVEQDRTIAFDVPTDNYDVITYADGACQASNQRIGGASGPIYSGAHHDWTVFARQPAQIH
jgi:ribonuclease HI